MTLKFVLQAALGVLVGVAVIQGLLSLRGEKPKKRTEDAEDGGKVIPFRKQQK